MSNPLIRLISSYLLLDRQNPRFDVNYYFLNPIIIIRTTKLFNENTSNGYMTTSSTSTPTVDPVGRPPTTPVMFYRNRNHLGGV